MKTKCVLWCIFLGIALLMVSCSLEKPSPVGAQYFERENRGAENHLVVYSAPSDTSYKTTVSCGKSTYLFFGMDKDIEALTFVVFDTVKITEPILKAVLSFQTILYIASETLPIDVSVYTTDATWEETSITWENHILPSSTGPIQTVQIQSADTFMVEAEIPAELAAAMVTPDSLVKRIGIMLKVDAGGCLFQSFSMEYSSTSEAVPHLTLYTASDTLSVWPEKDAFVANTNRAPVADRIRIQNGIAERSLLFFDLSAIPSEASINRALLILHSESGAAVPNDTSAFYFTIYPLADSLQNVSDVRIDTALVASGSIKGDSCRAVITSIVQYWTAKTIKNAGIMLNGILEESDLAGQSLYSAQADSSLMPKLDVFYSLPPSSRF
jgi:hypothetical protein